MNKLIINFAPTGMVPTKKITPHVPISSKEIIEEVLNAASMGASIVHLHVRDESGEPDYRKEIYEEIIAGIREINKELILCVSTSGRKYTEFEKRSEVLDLKGKYKPDMASLTLSSLNFVNQASLNSPDMVVSLLKKMKDNDIKPELEIFDLGMINYSKYLIKKGLLKPPYYYNLIFGNIASAQANLLSVAHMLNELLPSSIWSLGGIGDYQKNINFLGVVWGGGVRIGLEDNVWFDSDRKQLATNEELLRRIVNVARAAERKIATPNEVRKMLRLKKHD